MTTTQPATTMTQFAFQQGFALGEGTFSPQSSPLPQPGPQDLLVKLTALAVNPVDTKLRQSLTGPNWHVLGYDAVGTIQACGTLVHDFTVGEQVYYAGAVKRAGSYATYQLVDQRLVSPAPQTLTAAQSAAIPLTGLTAWELLFERMGFGHELTTDQLATIEAGASTPTQLGFPDNHGKQLLIINGAGGVGTMLSQLASWAGFRVAATASPAHFSWLRAHQVDLCLDYHQDLTEQLAAANWGKFDGIAILTTPDNYFQLASQQIAPFGKIGCIVETPTSLPIGLVKNLNVSWDWEYMFGKTDANVRLASQGLILRQLAQLLDQRLLQSTLTKTLTGLTAENLLTAHHIVESGHVAGKVVLTV